MSQSEIITRQIWRKASAVCFDVDSTLSREEGIDELASYCGAGAEVKEWTKKAMGGSVTFQEALGTRLNIISPSLNQLTEFKKLKKPSILLTPGIPELVSLLHERGTAVYLVSGGFRSLIEPMAEYLGIPKKNIYANKLLFHKGMYVGVDEAELTSRSGGKTRVLEKLKQQHHKIVMIGDGATDMEAYPPADAFIGFGGNMVREVVKKNAPWYVYSMQDLIDELKKEHEKLELPAFRSLLYTHDTVPTVPPPNATMVTPLAAN